MAEPRQFEKIYAPERRRDPAPVLGRGAIVDLIGEDQRGNVAAHQFPIGAVGVAIDPFGAFCAVVEKWQERCFQLRFHGRRCSRKIRAAGEIVAAHDVGEGVVERTRAASVSHQCSGGLTPIPATQLLEQQRQPIDLRRRIPTENVRQQATTIDAHRHRRSIAIHHDVQRRRRQLGMQRVQVGLRRWECRATHRLRGAGREHPLEHPLIRKRILSLGSARNHRARKHNAANAVRVAPHCLLSEP